MSSTNSAPNGSGRSSGSPERKLEAIALAEPAIIAALEDAAQTKTQEWLRNYKKEIASLNEASRQSYVEVRELATRPELIDREPYPDRIQVTKADKRWSEHVYVDEVGLYPSKTKLN